MSGRSLSFLATVDVDRVKGIGPRTAGKLRSVGVATVADLLLHVPRRYLDRSELFDLAGAPLGEEVTVGGTVEKFSKRRIRGNRTMVEAEISDGTSRMKVVWFNPYINLEEGIEVALSGKIERFRGRLQMKSPDVDRFDRVDESLVAGRVVPVHPSLAGLSPHQVRVSVDNALKRARPILEVLPAPMLAKHRLVGRDTARDEHLGARGVRGTRVGGA
jgi:ATP-dependent DNA helicase RecG